MTYVRLKGQEKASRGVMVMETDLVLKVVQEVA